MAGSAMQNDSPVRCRHNFGSCPCHVWRGALISGVLDPNSRSFALGQQLIQCVCSQYCTSHGAGYTTGAKNERGMHTDTEETDCEECKCDLYLFAVVSPMRPGRATCPEHAAVLSLPHHQMILLYR